MTNSTEPGDDAPAEAATPGSGTVSAPEARASVARGPLSSNLATRLREHAQLHEDLIRDASDEQVQWAKDLREAADLLDGRRSDETPGEPAEPMLLGEAIDLLKNAGYPATEDWRQRYRRLIDLYDHLKSSPVEASWCSCPPDKCDGSRPVAQCRFQRLGLVGVGAPPEKASAPPWKQFESSDSRLVYKGEWGICPQCKAGIDARGLRIHLEGCPNNRVSENGSGEQT